LFLALLFDGQEPVHLRGFLFRLLVLVRDLADGMKSLGELVCQKVGQAFENLRMWFGFVEMKMLRSEF
jgi:hypothetical protein